MNDERVLWLSSIYRKAMCNNFFNELNLHEGIKIYIIEKKGYPMLPWLMVPHKQT
jgi:hypothetical protein